LKTLLLNIISDRLKNIGYEPEVTEGENDKMIGLASTTRDSFAEAGKFAVHTSWEMDDDEIRLVKNVFSHGNNVPSFIDESIVSFSPRKKDINIDKASVRSSISDPKIVSCYESRQREVKDWNKEKRKMTEMRRPATKEYVEHLVKEIDDGSIRYRIALKWFIRKEFRYSEEKYVNIDMARISIYDKRSVAFRPITSFDIDFYPEHWIGATGSKSVVKERVIETISKNALENNLNV
jgi:hypothetical protein